MRSPASPSRADHDEPATGQRTRPYGFAPDIACSWRVNRTCRTAPELMRPLVANYDTFRQSTRRNRDVQNTIADLTRAIRVDCKRSEERRVGKGGVSSFRFRWSPSH